MKSFDQFIQQARMYKQKGSENEVALMYLLLEMESMQMLWSKRYGTWGRLLKMESLTTATRFENFKIAKRTFPRGDLDRYGLGTCIALARLPEPIREKALPLVKSMWKTQRSPLTPQSVISVIRQVSPKHDPQVHNRSLSDLRRHVRRLEAMMLTHGIEPPTIESLVEKTVEEGNVLDAAVAFVRAKYRFKSFFPSSSDADLLKIATSQVSIASASLQQVIKLREKKSEIPQVVLEGKKTVSLVDAAALLFEPKQVRALYDVAEDLRAKWKVINLLQGRSLTMQLASALADDPRFQRVGAIKKSMFRYAPQASV